jgi:HTH-type transcriptional regulator/antitoxin HigA
MQEIGIKNKDLEPIIGSKGHVSAIMSGKRKINQLKKTGLKKY